MVDNFSCLAPLIAANAAVTDPFANLPPIIAETVAPTTAAAAVRAAINPGVFAPLPIPLIFPATAEEAQCSQCSWGQTR